MKKIKWCEEANINHYKIASRTVEDTKLCEKIIETGKKVIISLGMYDYENKNLPFQGSNIKYLYCVSKYPTNLTDIKMPDFQNHSFFVGIVIILLASPHAYLRQVEGQNI